MMAIDRTATLKKLANATGPVVSVVCPLDHLAPGNLHDEQVLTELRKGAERSLAAYLGEDDADGKVRRSLDESFAAVDREHPGRGVAMFSGSDVAFVAPLDISVEPRFVVGDHFALTELVADTSREARARLLVLSLAKTRCIDITGRNASEHHDAGFPIEVEAPTREETPHRDFVLDEQEHAEAVRFVFRAVDAALKTLHDADARPLVLMGAERDLAYWDEVSTSAAPVIGRVHGNYEWAGAAEIATLAAPSLELHQRGREQAAANEVREKLTSGAVCGIADVWDAARSGRGHRLVVEDGYHFSGRLVDDRLVPATAQAPDAFDAVDEAVREQICHGGEVVVAGEGVLGDCGRIAMVLRY